MNIFLYHIISSSNVSQSLFSSGEISLVGNKYDPITGCKSKILIHLSGLKSTWHIYPADSDALKQVNDIFCNNNNISMELVSGDKLPIAFATHPQECLEESKWLSISTTTLSEIVGVVGHDIKSYLASHTEYYKKNISLTRVINPEKNLYDIWIRYASKSGCCQLPGWFEFKSNNIGNDITMNIDEYLSCCKPIFDIPAPYLKFCWIDIQNMEFCITEDSRYVNLLYPGDERNINFVKKPKPSSLRMQYNYLKKNGTCITQPKLIDTLIGIGKQQQKNITILDKMALFMQSEELKSVDIMIHVCKDYPYIKNVNEISVMDLILEHVYILWQSSITGNSIMESKLKRNKSFPLGWKYMMHIISKNQENKSNGDDSNDIISLNKASDKSIHRLSISSDFREKFITSNENILSSSFFESRITYSPWQLTCDFIAHPSRKVQWFLSALLSSNGYTILPSISMIHEDNNKNIDISYKGGFNMIKAPGIYKSSQDNSESACIAQIDIFSCYATVISEFDLCLTDNTKSGIWNKYFDQKLSFNPITTDDIKKPVIKLSAIAEGVVSDLILDHKKSTLKPTKPLAIIVSNLLSIRKYCKGNTKLLPLALAIKKLLNSMYGSFAFKDNRYFAPLLSAVIASTVRSWINEFSQITTDLLKSDTLACITDCIIISLKNNNKAIISNTEIDKSINPILQYNPQYALSPFKDWIYKRFESLTVDTSTIFKSIFIQATGKYAALIMNTDNSKDAKLIVKGMESVRNDWSPWASDIINSILKEMLQNEKCTIDDIMTLLVKLDCWKVPLMTELKNRNDYYLSLKEEGASRKKIEIDKSNTTAILNTNSILYNGCIISNNSKTTTISSHPWKLTAEDNANIDEQSWQHWYLYEQIFVPLAKRILPLCPGWNGNESISKLANIIGLSDNPIITGSYNKYNNSSNNKNRSNLYNNKSLLSMLTKKIQPVGNELNKNDNNIIANSVKSIITWETAIKCLTCYAVVPLERSNSPDSWKHKSTGSSSNSSHASGNSTSRLICQMCKGSVTGTIDLSNQDMDIEDDDNNNDNNNNKMDIVESINDETSNDSFMYKSKFDKMWNRTIFNNHSNSMDNRIVIRKSQDNINDEKCTENDLQHHRDEYISNLNLLFERISQSTTPLSKDFKMFSNTDIPCNVVVVVNNNMDLIATKKLAENLKVLEYNCIKIN